MVLEHFGIELKFRDLDGLAKYPVDESQIDQARVLLTRLRGFAPDLSAAEAAGIADSGTCARR